ncbi:hypothetical protein FDG96_gp78 [Bacillus phage Mgbh1]|uniref:Uncharacterized protein n=1 Tax=Bacillus phage Mgbh1 TaxID=1796993 RepID=A0A142F1T0_9CAUD|nr:hypothetical protein FDG96_gp78 [Bacillus phage Mgbh1]AMQ66737.1 hypothetical protein [Bacillus phage Mgbh1]
MSRRLPEGFVEVRNTRIPRITFDRQFRFYFSKSLLEDFGLQIGDKVGLAYNKRTGDMLIDKKGRSFRIDSRQYISSKEFARANKLERADVPITYEFDEERSDDEFLVFYRLDDV